MQYYSTKNPALRVSFQEAVFNSLPADGGLYMPEKIPVLPADFLTTLADRSFPEIGFEVMRHFVGREIPDSDLSAMMSAVLSFDTPLVPISKHMYTLELFHGATWAFKDVGARFLAQVMGYFSQKSGRTSTILVATSGDTGGAVAAGFYRVPGVQVVILYPKGKVSPVQQLQLTTWGENIRALEVDGTFDDCQRMVKAAFSDQELNRKHHLSSANSINVARFLPQSLYYFRMYQQMMTDQLVVSVPSGNFGNLTAGLVAQRMGLPIKRFIAATNVNDPVPRYLAAGKFNPQNTIPTHSNAMDVGNPSNFDRMLDLFGRNVNQMRKLIQGISIDDETTLETMKSLHSQTGYVADPHGAVAYAGLCHFLQKGETGVFLETAHPVKFPDVVKKALGWMPDYRAMEATLAGKKSSFISISASIDALKEHLNQHK